MYKARGKTSNWLKHEEKLIIQENMSLHKTSQSAQSHAAIKMVRDYFSMHQQIIFQPFPYILPNFTNGNLLFGYKCEKIQSWNICHCPTLQCSLPPLLICWSLIVHLLFNISDYYVKFHCTVYVNLCYPWFIATIKYKISCFIVTQFPDLVFIEKWPQGRYKADQNLKISLYAAFLWWFP